MEDPTRIKLQHVKVVFANLNDDGFGKSITISVDPETEKKITQFVTTNKIGKGANAGKPNFKDYEGKKQYAFMISDFTRFAGLNGLDETKLGFGATISLVANSFAYDNKFGKGISSNLSAVLVERGADTKADADLAELMQGLGEPLPSGEDAPFEEIDLADVPEELR